MDSTDPLGHNADPSFRDGLTPWNPRARFSMSDKLSQMANAAPLSESPLSAPVGTMHGIGPARVAWLAGMGVHTIGDLLRHSPRAYADRRTVTPIAEVTPGATATLSGEVVRARILRLRRGNSIAEITLSDSTGEIKMTFFGRGYLAKALPPGTRLVVTGTVSTEETPRLKAPEYEVLDGGDDDLLHTGRIVPIYRLAEKISLRQFRAWVRQALDQLPEMLADPLPPGLLERYAFPGLRKALHDLHFPGSDEDARLARERFAYEELVSIQVRVLSLRARRRGLDGGIKHETNGPILRALGAALPFRPTGAQSRAIGDILGDMGESRPMGRLLQGDVGSGKTLVALHAIAAASDGGHQSAVMAPTEMLARQHFATMREALGPLGIRVQLLTSGATGGVPGRAIRAQVSSGEATLVVGTHALVQAKVGFNRLGLVIVDEQHRFGVAQRMRLAGKGTNPDVLHMTATPIPRTLAMTLYGAMDLSIIDELPPGRLPVKTRRIAPAKVDAMYAFVRENAESGFQTFIVCPLVEESDTRALKAITSHYEEISAGPLSELTTALVHGRMDSAEREAVMSRFKAGEVSVLFSTSVVEVGIDVPSATTMIIEDAAQFGLTQLHQLRGRVGRGGEQSHCFLLGEPKTEEGKERLEVFCRIADGFELAEEDLRLRGPGELYGFRQSGLGELKSANLVRDIRLLEAARNDVLEALEGNSAGALGAWRGLRDFLHAEQGA